MGADKYALKGLGRKKANLLIKDSSSLCVKVTNERNMTLSPVYIGSVCDGVAAQLESQINEYDTGLKGIVLAYEDIKLISSEASLIADRPFLYVKVKVTYLVFQPQIGSILTGIIKEMKESHVICVVHEIFNATIFQSPTLAWDVSTLTVGDSLPFEITEISKNTKFFFLKGKLASVPSNPSITDIEASEEQTDSPTVKETENSHVVTEVVSEFVEKEDILKISQNMETSEELKSENKVDFLSTLPKKRKKEKKKERRHSDEMD